MSKEQFRETIRIARKRQKSLKKKMRGIHLVEVSFEPTNKTQTLSDEALLAEIQQLGKSGTRKRRNRRG